MKIPQIHKQYFISTFLVCLIAWLYLLFPTSAPLALNGLPLDHKAELLVFVALTFTGFFYLVIRYLLRIQPVSRAQPGDHISRLRVWLEIVAVLALLMLIVVKLFFPESRQLTSCFEMPGVNDHACVWLPEGFRLNQPDQASRFEESISFAAPGLPWRLSTFNDARVFNLHKQPPESFERVIQDLRKSHSYPFSATFRIGDSIGTLLRQEYERNEMISLSVKYTGAVELLGMADQVIVFPYSDTEQSRSINLPVSAIRNLAIRYRNFRCAVETDTPSACAASLTVISLPLEAAQLHMAVLDPARGNWTLLGYAPLLAAGRRRAFFRAGQLLELLAGMIALASLLLSVHPYFSSFFKNRAQFGREARGHFAALIQLILVAVLSGVATLSPQVMPVRGLPNGTSLRILIFMGAGYVSFFLMVLFSSRANQFFTSEIRTLGRGFAIALFLPFLLYMSFALFIHVPPRNNVTFLVPGDDAMIYATDAMGILETGGIRNSRLPPTGFFAKPLFRHFRALYYGIFGGGEIYYSFLISTSFIFVWSLFVALPILVLSSSPSVVRALSWSKRIGIVAACALAFVTTSREFLGFGATFGGNGFSEGPAWFFGLASFALLITLPNSARPALTLRLIGFLFAASLCFRGQYLMFLPLVVFVGAFLRRDLPWTNVLINICLPVMLIGAPLCLYFLRHPPTIEHVQKLFQVGSVFGRTSSWDLFVRQGKLLFPSYWEFLSALAMLWVMALNWFGKGGRKRLIFLFFAYAATIIVFDGLIGEAAYYPRHIVMAFLLSSCATFALIQNLFLAESH